MADAEYDPFAAGPHQVDVRTIAATDQARGRLFPIEIWSPAQSGLRPVIVFSHYSGGHRRTAGYLCTHLASHGYVVAAMDHSEAVAPGYALHSPLLSSGEPRWQAVRPVLSDWT